MKLTKEEKTLILELLEHTRDRSETIACSPKPQRKSVWAYTDEDRLENKNKSIWIQQLIKKIEGVA
jgi:hypothetical protein